MKLKLDKNIKKKLKMAVCKLINDHYPHIFQQKDEHEAVEVMKKEGIWVSKTKAVYEVGGDIRLMLMKNEEIIKIERIEFT